MKNHAVPALVLVLFVALGRPGNARADSVNHWNAIAGNAALAACIAPGDDPLHESRMYAMAHIAIHDALNAIDRRSHPYVFDEHVGGRVSAPAAVAAAAHDVLVAALGEIPAPFPPACVNAGIAVVEWAYQNALASIPDTPAKRAGIATGRAAANAILRLRTGDGSDTPLLDFSYPQGTQPGEYRFTPGFNFVFAPGWADVTTFVLKDAGQFGPSRSPYAIGSKKYTADFFEVKAFGGDGVTTPSARNAEQTEIARFWVESSPLQWNRIARTVATAEHLDDWEQARLFALLNMAMADGYIGSFETKRLYKYWRPVTAIQTADSDGNPSTVGDPTWTPLVPTPPIPDYDSGHSVQGAVAAAVLEGYFGTDDVTFSTCSLTLPTGSRCNDPAPVLRSYESFSQAADENGLSRILVGFHFRLAVEEGLQHGRRIGERAVKRFLRLEKSSESGHSH